MLNPYRNRHGARSGYSTKARDWMAGWNEAAEDDQLRQQDEAELVGTARAGGTDPSHPFVRSHP